MREDLLRGRGSVPRPRKERQPLSSGTFVERAKARFDDGAIRQKNAEDQ
jgi:hypothetical protein